MELNTQRAGAELTVRLDGELNTLTAPDLTALLDRELDGVETVRVDFTRCDYVSSAGIRVLLMTMKRLKETKGRLYLTNVGENFREVLENTGLDAVFDVI